jgi:hypothetical protein
VYADANVPAGIVSAMRRDLRWDVYFVLEDDAVRRARDESHFERALDFGRTLITLDRDFLDPARFPFANSPGVIVCVAPDERALLRLLARLDRLLRAGLADPLPFRGRTLELTPASEWLGG